MKDQIENELAVLIGLPLRYASRAVDMGTFGFGNDNDDVFAVKPRNVPDDRLQTFACSATTHVDESDEFWRLIPPRITGDEPHVVVTAHGIER